jgi:hypothetical protein
VLATAPNAPLTIVGGGSGDSLVGSNAGNIFAITGSNAGTLSGSAYGGSVLFSQIGNLTAGSSGDIFQFADESNVTTLDFGIASLGTQQLG